MKDTTFIKQTIQLARAVNGALIAIGCVHRSRDGKDAIPVPLERTRYDPRYKLLWVEIDPSRLPRRFNFDTLLAVGLREKVAAIVGRPVVLAHHGPTIVIAMRLS